MSYAWEVTFNEVADPDAMATKLETGPFFRKCTAKKVEKTSNTMVFSSTPPKPHTLADIQKKCAENGTFKNAGIWRSKSTTECTPGVRPETQQAVELRPLQRQLHRQLQSLRRHWLAAAEWRTSSGSRPA